MKRDNVQPGTAPANRVMTGSAVPSFYSCPDASAAHPWPPFRSFHPCPRGPCPCPCPLGRRAGQTSLSSPWCFVLTADPCRRIRTSYRARRAAAWACHSRPSYASRDGRRARPRPRHRSPRRRLRRRPERPFVLRITKRGSVRNVSRIA